MRERSDVPVLVLSARNDSADKVRALKLGADDYMTKPFWPDELLERVTRGWLMENVLDADRDSLQRTLDVPASRLRKNLAGPI